MKKILLALLLLASVKGLQAQDSIAMVNGIEIEAKVLEIGTSNIKYKKFSNLEGPLYTVSKEEVKEIVFQNGDVETYSNENSNIKSIERQTSLELIPGSRLFLTYSKSEDEDNVDGSDAIGMLKTYIEGKTNCKVVSSYDEADFVVDLRVIKKAMANRRAMIEITNIAMEKVVYESKWSKGTNSAFSGYSGSRAAIGNVVKKQLLKEYPNIEF